MKSLIVDASVIAAAFFREKYAEAARNVLLSASSLCTPDLLYAEIANVIWKRYRHGEIDKEEATELLNDVLDLPLEITPSEQLVGPALELALRTDRTVYDCLYVVLAFQEEAVLVTADQRLVNALAGGPLKDHVTWLGTAH